VGWRAGGCDSLHWSPSHHPQRCPIAAAAVVHCFCCELFAFLPATPFPVTSSQKVLVAAAASCCLSCGRVMFGLRCWSALDSCSSLGHSRQFATQGHKQCCQPLQNTAVLTATRDLAGPATHSAHSEPRSQPDSHTGSCHLPPDCWASHTFATISAVR
jgi:hypothetical protein